MPKLPDANPEILKLGAKEPTLLFAVQDLIKSGGVNFDEWWDDYKLGFPRRIKNKFTNYPVKDWIKPKYVELVPLGEENKSGVREIEYFPDADNELISYLIRGTDRDLIFHITAIGYQQSGSSEYVSSKNSKPLLKGYPRIKLTFYSENGIKAEKGIRVVGYTDDSDIAQRGLAKLVKPTDVLGWAKKIKTIFGDTKYIWKKGLKCVTYSGTVARLQGLENWALVPTKAEGIKLFTNILKIFDHTPDDSGFNLSNKINETQFTKPASSTKVLDKTVKRDQSRKVIDYTFYGADLQLPLLKKPIPLVRKNVIVYKG